ncbi:MAG TPA: hypothetical protein VK742_14630 [Candidatus Sulfotelmatobacter sp.]|jgi:tetratricopeptide (TPR) repeat protein|nr:hypothetical protein [Candidatus Sulfotelmatobacter sp.]
MVYIQAIHQGVSRIKTLEMFYISFVLATLTLSLYCPVINFDFVNYDDNGDVYANPIVKQGLTLEGFGTAFGASQSSNWVPLTMLSHMLDCQLFGLNAGGHHLTNVLLHTLSVVLLFWLLKKMTGVVWPSAFVAAVFAVHPLHIQSVAWIAERKDVLSGLFFMLTLWFYFKYAKQGESVKNHLLTFTMFTLGLMSKPMLVTLPLVMLILDYWPLQRWKYVALSKLLLEKVPFMLTSLLFGMLSILDQGEAMGPNRVIPFLIRIANAMVSTAKYIGQTFYPSNLSIFYPYPENNLSYTAVLGSIVLITMISYLSFIVRDKKPYLLAGWLWYLTMLLPVIGIIQVGAQSRADRYTYLPQIGLGLMVAWLAADLGFQCGRFKYFVRVVAVLSIVAMCAVSRSQVDCWRDTESLFRHAVDCTSDNPVAENILGGALDEKGNVKEALVHYQKAENLWPMSLSYHRDLGVALFKTGDTDPAIIEFKKVLVYHGDAADVHAYLGAALFEKGQVKSAVSQLRKSILLSADYEAARNELCRIAWKQATSPDAGIRNGTNAFKLARLMDKIARGTNAPAAAALAAAYAENGHYDQALSAAARARNLYLRQTNSIMTMIVNHEIKCFERQEPFHANADLPSLLKNPY